MNFFTKLKDLKTAAAFSDAIPQIEADLGKAEADVVRLEGQRESTIFGDGDVSALQTKINAAKDAAENLRVALSGAKRRHAEAATAETNAAIEVKMQGIADTVPPRLRANLIKFHAVASELAKIAHSIYHDERAIEAANGEVVAAKRAGLTIPSVYGEINGKRQQAYEAHYAAKGMSMPSNGTMAPIGTPLTGLTIPSYWPASSYDGDKTYLKPPLSFLK